MEVGVRGPPIRLVGGGVEGKDEQDDPSDQVRRAQSGPGQNEGAAGGQNDFRMWGRGAPPAGQGQYWSQGQPMDPDFSGGQFQGFQRPPQSWPGGWPGGWTGTGGWFSQGPGPAEEGANKGGWQTGGWKQQEAAPLGGQNSSQTRKGNLYPPGDGGGGYGVGSWGGLPPRGPHPPGGGWQEAPRERLPTPGETWGPGQKQVELQEERRVPEIPPSRNTPVWGGEDPGGLGSFQRGVGNQPGAPHAFQHGGHSAQGPEVAARENLRWGQSVGAYFLPPASDLALADPARGNTNPPSEVQQQQQWQGPSRDERKQALEGATWQQMADADGAWRAQRSFSGPERRAPSSGGGQGNPSTDWSKPPGLGGFGQQKSGPPGSRPSSSGALEQPAQQPPQGRADAGKIVAETFEVLKKDLMWPPQWEAYQQAMANMAMASGLRGGPMGFGGLGFPFGFPGFPQQRQGTSSGERPNSSEYAGHANARLSGGDSRERAQQEGVQNHGHFRRNEEPIGERFSEQGWEQSQGRGWGGRVENNVAVRRGGWSRHSGSEGRPSSRGRLSDSPRRERVSEERNVLRMQGGSVEEGASKEEKHGRGFDLNLDLNLSMSGPSDLSTSGPEEGGGFRQGKDPDDEVREHLRVGKRNARLEEEGRRREGREGRRETPERNVRPGSGGKWMGGEEEERRDQARLEQGTREPQPMPPHHQSEPQYPGQGPQMKRAVSASNTNPPPESFAPFAELMQHFAPHGFPPQNLPPNPNFPLPFMLPPGAAPGPLPFNPANPAMNPIDNWLRALAYQNPATLMVAYHLAGLGMQPQNPQTLNSQNHNPSQFSPPNPNFSPQNPVYNPPKLEQQGQSLPCYPGFPPTQEKHPEPLVRAPSQGGEMKRPQPEDVPQAAEKRQKVNHPGGSQGGSSGLGSDAERTAVSDGGLQRAYRADPWQARGAESAREGGGDAIEWDGTSTGTKRGRNKGTVEPLFPHVSILPTPKPAFKKPPPLVLLRDGTTVEAKKLSPGKRRELKKEREAHRSSGFAAGEGAKGLGGSRMRAIGPSEGGGAGEKGVGSRGLEVSLSPTSISEEAGAEGGGDRQGPDDNSIPSESEAPTVIDEGSQLANKEMLQTVTTIGQSSRGDGSGSDSTVAGGRAIVAARQMESSKMSEGGRSGKTVTAEEVRGAASCGTESGRFEGRKDPDQDDDDRAGNSRKPRSGFNGQGISAGLGGTAKGSEQSMKGAGSGSGSERSNEKPLHHGLMSLKMYSSKAGAKIRKESSRPWSGRLVCKRAVTDLPLSGAMRANGARRVRALRVPWKKGGSMPLAV